MSPTKLAADGLVLTEEDKANGHVSVDDAVLASLRSAAHRRAEIVPVTRIVVRGFMVPKVDPSTGKIVMKDGIPEEEPFSFRIRRLQRKERLECELAAQTEEMDPRYNNPNVTRTTSDQNEAELRCLYRATVREDRERFWDDSAAQQEWGVGTGWELIGQVLGDRQQAEAIIALHQLGDGIEQERTRLKAQSAMGGA